MFDDYTLNDTTNCYKICDYHYYFDSAKEYYCTDTEECPKDYSKLIEEKNECVISCGGEYPYEFENKCYKVCPDNTFYNYEHTFCIAAIPEGYYENATQTIDKCDIKCGECILGSVKQNLCVSCANKIYYYKKEDDNANPDGYYECYTGSRISRWILYRSYR